MKYPIIALALFAALGASAQSARQNSMLETFVKYASINSQSDDDNPWPVTAGQLEMAQAIKACVQQAIAKSNVKGATTEISADGYVYVRIPANIRSNCPSLGISCHLDVTPEAKGGNIKPLVDTLNGHTIVRTDGTTLLGADDKCGVTIAVELIRTILNTPSNKHGELLFAFCPNEDVGRAADKIDTEVFCPDILFDLDGEEWGVVTQSNFTARRFDVKFLGHDAHPGDAKAQKFGDAIAAASAYISYFPVESRPENSEGRQGYIHPWNLTKDELDVTVHTRVRYFDKSEGELFDRMLAGAIADVKHKFPNVKIEVVADVLQYENVAYTLHPQARTLVENAASKIGMDITFIDERGGTTAAMMAAHGLKGGMCIFAGMHEVHSTREYADLKEMEDAYNLMLEIIKEIPSLK